MQIATPSLSSMCITATPKIPVCGRWLSCSLHKRCVDTGQPLAMCHHHTRCRIVRVRLKELIFIPARTHSADLAGHTIDASSFDALPHLSCGDGVTDDDAQGLNEAAIRKRGQ